MRKTAVCFWRQCGFNPALPETLTSYEGSNAQIMELPARAGRSDARTPRRHPAAVRSGRWPGGAARPYAVCALAADAVRVPCARAGLCAGGRAAFVPGWRSGLRDISWPQRSGTGAAYPPCCRRLPADACSVGQDSALASILRSLAHELTHYFQWVRDPVGYQIADESRLERQADRCARETLYDYADVYAHP